MANMTDPANPVLSEQEEVDYDRFIETVHLLYPDRGPQRAGYFGRAAGLVANQWIIAAMVAQARGAIEYVGDDDYGFRLVRPA